MQFTDLSEANNLAIEKTSLFRENSSLDSSRPHNAVFHQFKNQYQFFGFIEVHIDGCIPFLMYSNNDDLVAMTYFWYGANSYERKSIEEWVKRAKSSKTILDVGSFSGLYSLAAASADEDSDRQIYAFEPTRRVYSRLLANIQANRMTRVITPIDYAISNRIGIVNFHQYRGNNVLGNGASFVDKGIPSTSSSEIVQAVDLDWFVSEKNISPDLVKIDVEQAEVLALEGMRQILSDAKPDILIEVTPETVSKVKEILSGYGYKLYAINEEKKEIRLLEDESCVHVTNLLAEY